MNTADKSGKAWVFGDDINTDALAPGMYLKGSFEDLASHCLEMVDSTFATNVRKGDLVVAGLNFGIGSSREQAAQVLQHLGVRTIIAKSFGGIFFRNALNFGLVAVVCAKADQIQPGDIISVDAATGTVINTTQNQSYSCDALSGKLLEMVNDGGLVAHLEKRLIPIVNQDTAE